MRGLLRASPCAFTHRAYTGAWGSRSGTAVLQLIIWMALLVSVASCSGGTQQNETTSKQQSLITNPGSSSSRSAKARSVWVVMKDGARLGVASSTKGWKARGVAVHTELQRHARASQASVVGWLKAKRIAHKSFWIVNAIKLEADAATIRALEARSDVAEVMGDYSYSVPKPIRNRKRIRTQAVNWNLSQIGVPEVWQDFGVRGEGITIANIDTGVEFDHPALAQQYRGAEDGTLSHDYNWFDPLGECASPDGSPCDTDGHGTHTMGSMVGDDGAENQVGVAPGARWIAAKGCGVGGCSLEALVTSGEWILAPTDQSGGNPRPDLRPQVVNNSWGGGPDDDFYQQIVQAWVAAGIFPVFANGNDGPSCGTSGSPGDYPESYSVGAFDEFDGIASFSSRGASPFGVIKPDVSAPGVDVLSSLPGGSYGFFSGTSMAAPHVAGAVALLWSAAPALSGDVNATRQLLDTTAVDREDLSCGGTAADNNVWGEGRLDVLGAMLLAPTGPTGTVSGAVLAPGGLPIEGATVEVAGSPRSARAAGDGAYSLQLPVGEYALSARAFGFIASTPVSVTVEEDATTSIDFELDASPSWPLSGTVTDADGAPLAGALVTLAGTPFPPQPTDADGGFFYPAVPEGEYELTATAGGCFGAGTVSVVLTAETELSVSLEAKADAYGNSCSIVPLEPVFGEEPLGLYELDGQVSVDLPFVFPFYGASYSELTITTNGYVAFDSPFPEYVNSAIPQPSAPNAAIYPLWDDLNVVEGGELYTAELGEAPNRGFLIEWYDVPFFNDPSQTATFQVILYESGAVQMQYWAADAPFAQGSGATVGIENAAGDDALQYSFNEATLSSGLAIRYEPPPLGTVTGTVVDKNDGLPLAGATVTATHDETGEELTALTAKDGVYRLLLPAGSYQLAVTRRHYNVRKAQISVAERESITRDFVLRTALGVVGPSAIQLVMPQDGQRTRTLRLGNEGTRRLQFSVGESGGQKVNVVKTKSLARNEKANPNARTTRELYAAERPAGVQPQDVGDVLAAFPVDQAEGIYGVGMAGNLWFSDILNLTNHEYTLEGLPTGLQHDAPWGEELQMGMTYDSSTGLMCQLAVGGNNGIHCWDPATGEVAADIEGPFPWTAISQRGLAYNPTDDTFYVGGWNEGIVYRIQGLSHDSPGEVISSCAPADGDISGLAYNASAHTLWVATNSPTDTVYQLNPDDCTVLSTLAHPMPLGFQGGGLSLNDDGNLWMIGQDAQLAFLVESGVPVSTDVPWLSVSPAEGRIPKGTALELEVTIDAAGMEPGLYLANLVLETNSGREPRLVVPVSVVVSGYLQAVNSGGEEYVDASGESWSADQAHSPGGWGFARRGRVRQKSFEISGTEEQALYQVQRQNPYAYRFDDVPNGIYEVDLRFAELTGKNIGKRLFDVIVEQELVLPAYDIVYEVGNFAASDERFFVEVSDGRIDLRLIPRAGFAKPVVNALRVTHRPDR